MEVDTMYYVIDQNSVLEKCIDLVSFMVFCEVQVQIHWSSIRTSLISLYLSKKKVNNGRNVIQIIYEGKQEHEDMRTFICEFRTTKEMLFKERNNSLRDDEVIFDVDQSIKRPPFEDDECYGVDDLEDTINAEPQELLASDKEPKWRIDSVITITVYKTHTGCTPFRLVYGKSYRLPVEIEHKVYWVLKQCNMDLTAVAKTHFMELNELMELRDGAYENTRIYKERTKRWHDSRLHEDKNFKVGDTVLLFNSRFKMHPFKTKSRCYGSNMVKTVYPYGTVEIIDKSEISFKVNGKRLKKYHDGHIDTEVIKDYLVKISKKAISIKEDTAYLYLHFTKDHKENKINTPYLEKTNTPYSSYGNKIFWKISDVVPTSRNPQYAVLKTFDKTY
nr:hypothetical protein [Tanacetum cinerariifolium]